MKTKKFNRMDGNYQRKVNDLVSREVLLNVSILMQTLHNSDDICSGEYQDELLNICGTYDYNEPTQYEINNSDNDTFRNYLDWDDNITATTRQELIDNIIDNDSSQAFCEYINIDPYYSESLEYWVVSSWLSDKLSEQGENVQEICNMKIWGRTCSGQAISIDSVVCDIYENLNS